MRRVVNLSTYLKSYGITKEQFMAEVEKDREFYDIYVDWNKDDTKTILGPKVLDRLGAVFNDDTIAEIEKKEEDSKTDISEVKEGGQVEISDYMNSPISSQIGNPKSEKVKDSGASTKPKPKKKSKLSITKQFVQENGAPGDVCDMKGLRQFLLGAGLCKVEEVALMGDDEVLGAIGKEYFFIPSNDKFFIFKKSVLLENMGDIYVIDSSDDK